MKLTPSLVIKTLWSALVKEPIARKIDYTIDAANRKTGKKSYKVNGVGKYWGKYASVEKIAELALTLKTEDDWFTFYLPAKEYDYKYSHRIGIYGTTEEKIFTIEFLEASSQCGAHVKKIAENELINELESLSDISDKLEENGYVWEEF